MPDAEAAKLARLPRMHIETSIRNRGGAAATHELHGDGFDVSALRSALRAGRIVRVRQGWYLESGRHPSLVEAVRVGGRLTCGPALRLHDVWVFGDVGLHVAVVAGACQLRQPHDRFQRLDARRRGTVVHWSDRHASPSRLIVDPIEALADMLQCSDPELVAASTESLLHNRPDLKTRVAEFVATAPTRALVALRAVDGRSESGTEFVFRFRIARRGIRPTPQVQIAGIGRVDFVIGHRLVVEVDGAEYHVDPVRFEADRRRDALLSARGFRVLRFSHRLVFEEWGIVEAAVLAAVARLDHL
jgi:very-short-patch-repair endonuclease